MFVDRVCRRIQDSAYPRDIKATGRSAVPLVLERDRQTERLGKVLLVQPDNASLLVQRPVEAAYQQHLDLADLDDGGFRGFESERTGKIESCCSSAASRG